MGKKRYHGVTYEYPYREDKRNAYSHALVRAINNKQSYKSEDLLPELLQITRRFNKKFFKRSKNVVTLEYSNSTIDIDAIKASIPAGSTHAGYSETNYLDPYLYVGEASEALFNEFGYKIDGQYLKYISSKIVAAKVVLVFQNIITELFVEKEYDPVEDKPYYKIDFMVDGVNTKDFVYDGSHDTVHNDNGYQLFTDSGEEIVIDDYVVLTDDNGEPFIQEVKKLEYKYLVLPKDQFVTDQKKEYSFLHANYKEDNTYIKKRRRYRTNNALGMPPKSQWNWKDYTIEDCGAVGHSDYGRSCKPKRKCYEAPARVKSDKTIRGTFAELLDAGHGGEDIQLRLPASVDQSFQNYKIKNGYITYSAHYGLHKDYDKMIDEIFSGDEIVIGDSKWTKGSSYSSVERKYNQTTSQYDEIVVVHTVDSKKIDSRGYSMVQYGIQHEMFRNDDNKDDPNEVPYLIPLDVLKRRKMPEKYRDFKMLHTTVMEVDYEYKMSSVCKILQSIGKIMSYLGLDLLTAAVNWLVKELGLPSWVSQVVQVIIALWTGGGNMVTAALNYVKQNMWSIIRQAVEYAVTYYTKTRAEAANRRAKDLNKKADEINDEMREYVNDIIYYNPYAAYDMEYEDSMFDPFFEINMEYNTKLDDPFLHLQGAFTQ